MLVFCKGVRENKTLLSLNVANCFNAKKDADLLGERFKEMLEVNKDLIDFEFGFNGISLDNIIKIQELLRRNKATYDENALREWRERKQMRDEDSKL